MGRGRHTLKRRQAISDVSRVSPDKSEAKLEKVRQATERQIDEFMKRVGYANPSERTDEQGWRWFDYGSAKGRAGIVVSDPGGEMFLRVESLVMGLPSDSDELASLMRELLETNMTIAGPTRLAINGEGVFVCSTMPIVELRSGDVPAHIYSVMTIAESFNNPFSEQVKQEEASQENILPERQPDPASQATVLASST